MSESFGVVTIVGVGLLGASLGRALKETGLADRVRGVGRRQTSLDTALGDGAIEEAFLDVRDAAAGADLIVICTPAAMVIPTLDTVRPVCGGAVVTDVASTKQRICEHAARTWPAPVRVIPSHPMAGSEKFGPEHADPKLYEESTVIMTPFPGQDAEAYATVIRLWRSVGANIVEMAPERHDAVVARTSHIPHIMASAVSLLARAAGAGIQPAVGAGFRDVTRVAAGRAEIWRDICLTNDAAIAAGLDELIKTLEAVRDLIRRGAGEDLDRFFDEAHEARKKVLEP